MMHWPETTSNRLVGHQNKTTSLAQAAYEALRCAGTVEMEVPFWEASSRVDEQIVPFEPKLLSCSVPYRSLEKQETQHRDENKDGSNSTAP